MSYMAQRHKSTQEDAWWSAGLEADFYLPVMTQSVLVPHLLDHPLCLLSLGGKAFLFGVFISSMFSFVFIEAHSHWSQCTKHFTTLCPLYNFPVCDKSFLNFNLIGWFPCLQVDGPLRDKDTLWMGASPVHCRLTHKPLLFDTETIHVAWLGQGHNTSSDHTRI